MIFSLNGKQITPEKLFKEYEGLTLLSLAGSRYDQLVVEFMEPGHIDFARVTRDADEDLRNAYLRQLKK